MIEQKISLIKFKDWNDSLRVITHADWGHDGNRVVRNRNEAIKFAKNNGLQKTEYHLIATDNTLYPKDYAENILTYMDSNPQVATASGNYASYKLYMPHGADRIVRNSFFENTSWHGYYPEKMGFESAILYEANYHGFRNHLLNEVRFEHTRLIGTIHRFHEFGASVRALGYHPLYALATILNCFVTGKVTGRIGSLYILYFYLTFKPEP